MNRTQLVAAGKRLFGPDWKAPLARAIGRTYRHLLRILNDDKPIDQQMELAIVGIEALRGGFTPSWGSAPPILPAKKIPGGRRPRGVAQQVRP